MSLAYCVVPHYDQEEPTKVTGWCVVERSSNADKSLGCYPSREEAQAVCQRLSDDAENEVA